MISSIAAEESRVYILEMIVRTERLSQILLEIARGMTDDGSVTRAAIFIARGDRLELSGCCGFSDKFGELSLADLSNAAPLAELPGWHGLGAFAARPLISGAGEILGATAVLRDEAVAANAAGKAFELLESLAALAIEHDNLLSELTWRAEYDRITGVHNRHWFEQKLALMAYDARRSGASFAAACLNADHFRLINDVLGFRVGNRLLREIAARFQSSVAPGTSVARASGNEFLFLISGVSNADEARIAGEKLLGVLKDPFLIEGHEVFVSASVGIAVANGEASGNEDLQSRAYAAMSCAKARGRNQVAVFDVSMVRNSRERLEMTGRLRGALAKGEIELHYQPQISLRTGDVAGMEALLRWKHEAIGYVSPAAFIPIAEEAGLIADLGEWAIAEASRQSAAWKRAGLPDLRIAVNVSPVHFARRDFGARLLFLLATSEDSDVALELEITESVLMANLDRACDLMQELALSGIRFAIDDFGTGHSSLAYLQKFPVQRLKIPQNFTREITSAVSRPTLLANIIRLGRDLGLICTAEGVETAEQAIALDAMGCDEAQGYLYAKAMTGDEAARWLEAGPRTPTAQFAESQ